MTHNSFVKQNDAVTLARRKIRRTLSSDFNLFQETTGTVNCEIFTFLIK